MGNLIHDKSLAFAGRIMKQKTYLQHQKEFDIAGQIGRSGTAIGALVREAHFAESTSDFVHKMRIALKEANETIYWLEVLQEAGLLGTQLYISLRSDAEELVRILVCIVNTSLKKKLNS